MAQESSIVRILIASDIHAGFGENKPYIANDSFNTLEEVLKKGVEKNVDFVLMAGDLFHENHPTRETQLKVVRLLRKYCLEGEKPTLEFVSDPIINFQHSHFECVNYQDPNLNISLPIFTIHGNHDDLSGSGLSALDVLHETGLINLFGKFCDVDQIEVSPILLRREETTIAIYGIGSQRDDRLARAFAKGCVKFIRPQDQDSCFTILVLHQNRPPRNKLRSTKSHLSFKCIPTWFDLVIWGHEHECLIDPEPKYPDPSDESTKIYICQPGSTIATSLSPEETAQKHIGVLSIRKKEFRIHKIPLETTRQVIIIPTEYLKCILEELFLDEAEPATKIARSSVRQKNMPDEKLIIERINKILERAEQERKPTQPQPPRIRLKVTYSGKWLNIPPINGRKFGHIFAERVANPAEMISVRIKREEEKTKKAHDPLSDILGQHTDDLCSVDEMVNKYFTKCDFKNRLNVLSEISMGKQLQEYSNTELNTQYKYTTADKSMNEDIKEQINKLSLKVKEMIQEKMEQNVDEEETPLDQQIVNCIFSAKRERVKAEERSENVLDESDMSFLERGYDPSRMITSTPRASQDREIRWAESIYENARRQGPDENEMMDVSENDFSPSP